MLAVHVVAREDGAPLAGVGVNVRPKPLADDELRTGDDGWTEVAVPAGQELVVNVWPEPGHHGSDSRSLAALTPGERAEVELTLATRLDSMFYGRLVDAESGEAVPSAVLHRLPLGGPSPEGRSDHEGHERGPGVAPVDAQGRFQLEIGTWDFVLLCTRAPGWSLATVQLAGGHETPEAERVIRLVRAAQLVVEVLDGAGRALEGLLLTVSRGDEELSSQELGRCTISVQAKGACVGWDGVEPGAAADFRVPGAHLRVVATRGGRVVRELEVDVLAGETTEVVLE